MAVKRIVANIAVADMAAARAFYAALLGLEPVMDFGWIATFAGDAAAVPQLTLATEGGSGMPVPDVSIEVDDLDAAHARALQAGARIEYGPVEEPWEVRRFFVRDPDGRLLNILVHCGQEG